MRPIELVLSKLPSAKKTRNGWDAKCPAHEDNRASLSVREGGGGRVLLTCHARCETEAICKAMKLKMRDLFAQRAKGTTRMKGKNDGKIVAEYDYHDADGQLVFQVLRYEPKGFRQRRPDGNGGWIWNMDAVQRVLFQLPELLRASAKKIVFAVEGEKDVIRLRKLGCVATCNPGGAGKWSLVDDSPLHGRRVVIIVDNDDAGRKHGREVAKSLLGKASEIRIVELPDVPPKGDVSDFLETHNVDELHALVAKSEPLVALDDVRQTPAVAPITRNQAREVFARWMTLEDWSILDVVIGTVMAHQIEGDPLWLFIVGPPGSAKTETLRALSAHPSIYSVSKLSPAAMISGYITDGPDPSLLPKLDGKVLVVKDFTAILQMQHDARQEVISMLRDAYDGEAAKVFGTGQTKSYRSRFGMIAAVTPVIDEFGSINAMLGERFLRYRLSSGGELDKIARALSNVTSENSMREELSRAAAGVLAQNPAVPSIPQPITTKIMHLANLLAKARSEVSRDRRGSVTHTPIPEVGTRLAKQLKKLALGVSMARGLSIVDESVYRIVVRVALDTLPSVRARLIRGLWLNRESFEDTQSIADPLELDTDTCRVWLTDLRLLGIVDRKGERPYRWRLRSSFVEDVTAADVWPEGSELPPDSAPLIAQNEDASANGYERCERGGVCHTLVRKAALRRREQRP